MNRLTHSRATLTGRARPRPSWFGRQVLQVELRRDYYQMPFPQKVLSSSLEWTDAKWQHLALCPDLTIGRPQADNAKETT